MGNKLQISKYAGVLAICFTLGILAGFNPLAVRVNHYAYDLMLSGLRDTWTPSSVVVAIDEQTLMARGGVRNMRSILAEALDKIYDSGPEAIAIDVILADQGDPEDDTRAERCRSRGTVTRARRDRPRTPTAAAIPLAEPAPPPAPSPNFRLR